MEAIVKQNEVFLFIKNDTFELADNIPDGIVIVNSDITENQLFGGRVRLTSNGEKISVDGIKIRRIKYDESDGEITLSEWFPKDSVCSFLNQMEMLGVDTFLSNYKQSLLDTKSHYEELALKLETDISVSDNSDLRRRLRYIRSFLGELICTIFIIAINMNAGMDNHMYSNAFNEFINLYIK